jgi:uncharacterized membrane protein YkvA (DUF1232 family)
MKRHDAPAQWDFYRTLRAKVRLWTRTDTGRSSPWAEYLLLAPDLFHLLCRLAVDPEVPRAEKAKLAAAIAYFVSPLDLIPEMFLGPIGYADDVALAAYVLNGIVNQTRPEVVARHWAGDGDVLEVIRRTLAAADRLLGSGLWKRLKSLVR